MAAMVSDPEVGPLLQDSETDQVMRMTRHRWGGKSGTGAHEKGQGQDVN